MKIDRGPVAYHDAAFAVIGRALDIAIRPPAQQSGLRLFEGDVFMAWKARNAAEDLERMAVVALAGHIALNRYQEGTQGDRDELMAKDLIFTGLLVRYGPALLPGFVRSYVRNRATELTAEAEHLVAKHWPAIEAEAASLLAAPQRQAV
jgi:hypothetical protein